MTTKQELLSLELRKNTHLKGVPEEDEGSEAEEWGKVSVTETSSSETNNSSKVVLAADETRLVTRSKTIFLVVLMLAAIGSGYAAFVFTRNYDNRLFETAAEEYANEINRISQISSNEVYKTLDSMTKTVTSYAQAINATWPYVIINNFEERTKQLLEMSGASGLGFQPLVPKEDFDKWTNYTLETNAGLPWDMNISKSIYRIRYNDSDVLAPIWQRNPATLTSINRDVYNPERHAALLESRGVTVAGMNNIGAANESWPRLVVSGPVFDSFEPDAEMVAYFTFLQPVHTVYTNILPDSVHGMVVVVDPTDCFFADTTISYAIDGPNCTYMGPGDLHDPAYEYLGFEFDFSLSSTSCDFSIRIYPSADLEKEFKTTKPITYAGVVFGLFVFTSMFFCVYDSLVEKRQTKVLDSAEKTGALVSSLFPEQFRDRLLQDAEERQAEKERAKAAAKQGFRVNQGLKLSESSDGSNYQSDNNLLNTKPLAEFFPAVTVMFGDIAGFTAWASIREPAQVFTLLEQIYSAFDAIAKRRKIFKVETIGDCYVAVAGLPEKREDHAIVMARFASDCRATMNRIVRKLEVLLGPDTADLQMRFGLHSGPVTAGVLRGEKCRFQLFGDTVNTCSRIESTGMKNMIQLSEDTANLLMTAGFPDWVQPRDSYVAVKGKGAMQTYWLTIKRRFGGNTQDTKMISDSMSDRMSQGSAASMEELDSHRLKRLIDWNVEVLVSQMKKIVAMRDSEVAQGDSSLRFQREAGETVLDEVKEIIPLSTKKSAFKRNPEMVLLDRNVILQLEDYVSSISTLYRRNSFHNFEHASHVTMSVTKLLSRVVSSDTAIDNKFQSQQSKKGLDETTQLHEYTYGITSDPIIHFACALSALIHDVDHTGVPNATLIKENAAIAETYRNQSVAEQNSVDLAWELLMEPRYDDLRACLCTTQEELDRLRHLVVNCVMATDIADKELGALRKNRWNQAFNENIQESSQEDVNRKATIVIEHIIQASDVSHTMQHWHVYLKWNERFFHECYRAYLDGRAEKDPSEGWYQGELGFFDFYIIPLAKKLKECQVFGVTSDELLNYAVANREEWEAKGKDVVAAYMAEYKENKEKNQKSNGKQ